MLTDAYDGSWTDVGTTLGGEYMPCPKSPHPAPPCPTRPCRAPRGPTPPHTTLTPHRPTPPSQDCCALLDEVMCALRFQFQWFLACVL